MRAGEQSELLDPLSWTNTANAAYLHVDASTTNSTLSNDNEDESEEGMIQEEPSIAPPGGNDAPAVSDRRTIARALITDMIAGTRTSEDVVADIVTLHLSEDTSHGNDVVGVFCRPKYSMKRIPLEACNCMGRRET